jgi:transcriptional regulator with XRE-family HTH domain
MKEYQDLRLHVLHLTQEQFSLLLGCNRSDVTKIERRKRHNAFTEAFFAIFNYDPFSAVKGLLHKCVALRRKNPLTEKEIKIIKDLAKGYMNRDEYGTWEDRFDMLCMKKQMEKAILPESCSKSLETTTTI